MYEPNTPNDYVFGSGVRPGSKLGHEGLSETIQEKYFGFPKASLPPKAMNICATAVRRRRNMP